MCIKLLAPPFIVDLPELGDCRCKEDLAPPLVVSHSAKAAMKSVIVLARSKIAKAATFGQQTRRMIFKEYSIDHEINGPTMADGYLICRTLCYSKSRNEQL